MLIVDDRLISDEVLSEQFVCNLKACKGACCHEGDYGAPLLTAERAELESEYAAIKPYITVRGQQEIEARGLYEFVVDKDHPAGGEYATPCIDGAACAFMTRTPEGIAACGIEQAWRAGATPFRKPISCQLYPIRVVRNEEADFEALNYDRWDICSAACAHGKAHQVPVFRFVREAIERRWGTDFYDQLEAAYEAGYGQPDATPEQ